MTLERPQLPSSDIKISEGMFYLGRSKASQHIQHTLRLSHLFERDKWA